jgi:hypothetical protein
MASDTDMAPVMSPAARPLLARCSMSGPSSTEPTCCGRAGTARGRRQQGALGPRPRPSAAACCAWGGCVGLGPAGAAHVAHRLAHAARAVAVDVPADQAAGHLLALAACQQPRRLAGLARGCEAGGGKREGCQGAGRARARAGAEAGAGGSMTLGQVSGRAGRPERGVQGTPTGACCRALLLLPPQVRGRQAAAALLRLGARARARARRRARAARCRCLRRLVLRLLRKVRLALVLDLLRGRQLRSRARGVAVRQAGGPRALVRAFQGPAAPAPVLRPAQPSPQASAPPT